ncbi:HAMP domain-containing histidine kinase [Peptoniphilus sp. KCTC 25270]|uniref:sensor histidine kinase n=1 Tax=Peptoniphilus sp. KCTC 25270 TaxID=2897414 RepID=UPI001E337466|nr:HAMP domain-containing sensor histidine kinase [Peptoniphilus sp. KCTC 25270]MCD1147256.1 HAMP domain-containing histidine kinase [Peptoniphilus sp. KCTC 25270]
MPFIFGLLAVPILRLLFLGEDVVIQNRILRAAIKETQSYEALTGFSPMVKISTYESLMDLTRIKDQMYRSAQESVQSQKMKTELITNISHDLKTPLTSIINYADILSKKDVMDQEAQNYIRILGRNSERLKSLIVDLIDASKTGTGNVNLEPVFIDFHELINQIYADFDNEYEKKGLDFVYEYTEEYIPIYTDGNVLSRVIQNLFSNVNKYSMENTKVYGRTHLSGDRIFFSLRNISEKEITISSEELQTQFTRGELSRTTEGSGLGLYIAKNLVEILQGEFRIIVDGNYFQVFVELPTELKKDEK